MTTQLIAFADGLVMGMVTNAKGARLSFLYSNDWLASPSAYLRASIFTKSDFSTRA
jgi:hypothetical protein